MNNAKLQKLNGNHHFIFIQNIQYSSHPQQPGPAYFKSARKCGILGIACEPLSMQGNYRIDEADDSGKGSNATISMLHHFLENHSVGETHLQLHTDNCVAQNKYSHAVLDVVYHDWQK